MKTTGKALSMCAAILLSSSALAADTDQKTVINPDTLSDSTKSGYAQIVVVAPGARIAYVAGQVGISKDGSNTFEEQVDRTFENLIKALEAAGSSVEDTVKITVLIKDHDQSRLDYVNKKRREIFGDSPPASTLIPVPVLATDIIEFEVDAIAIVPEKAPAD
ncbi:RidA family protein [Pseudovibrio sp. Ad26]|uniref:RidA family protein n=1 Tax=Pseudovibrio sp. Ad26 TaxID=989410 RepID=UPI0007AE5CB7|nr:RidA family protein [Pseudovibrio sp. Ad26]KZL16139.1 RutC family protein YjgH [Pseudovibrio sp. Ad26]